MRHSTIVEGSKDSAGAMKKRNWNPKVMDIMFAWFWDLGEDTSDELEDIESLSVRVVEQGVVVRGFALIEEGACAFGPMDA